LVRGDVIEAVIAVGLVAALAACQVSPEIAERRAAQPAAIAAAICLQQRPNDVAGCDALRLPDPASEIAYAGCLDYNRKDLKPCSRLRLAYEDELRAYLGAHPAQSGDGEPQAARPQLSGSRIRDLHRTAEQLYQASNSDADTFQAALLIPDIRHKIEMALRQRLTDAELQALLSRTRADAVYWYQYMQDLERGERRY
jgi:hypothetical protein